MKTMTKREAQRSAALLWATAATEPVYILEKGKPRYRVERIDGELDPLDELDRRGLLTRASADPAPIPEHPGGPTYTEESFAALLDEMKGDH